MNKKHCPGLLARVGVEEGHYWCRSWGREEKTSTEMAMAVFKGTTGEDWSVQAIEES